MKKFLSVLALSGIGLLPSTVFASAASDAILNDIKGGIGNITFGYFNYDQGTIYTTGDGTFGSSGSTSAASTVAAGQTTLDGVSQIPTAGANPVGEDSWGIARVNTVEDSGANLLYVSGAHGAEMTVMFHGLKDYYLNANGAQQTTNGAGMIIDIYVADNSVPANNFTPGQGTAGRTATDAYNTVTDGTKVLSLVAIGGHINIGTDAGGADAQFQSLFNTSNNTGKATAFVSVVGGDAAWVAAFNSNYFDGTDLATDPAFAANAALGLNYQAADGKLESETIPNSNPTIGDWLVQSHDPLRLRLTAAVPEPITAASGLMALGALALSATRRRKA